MPPSRTPLADRFWTKVDKTDGCWLWTAAGAPGYGRIKGDGDKILLAHRVAYEWLVGPIPEGLELDHLCRVPACVNPDHLEPVTGRENMRRADIALGTRSATQSCPHGHPYDEKNTYWYGNKRMCRACRAERDSARAARKALPAEERYRRQAENGRARAAVRRKQYEAMEKPPCCVGGCDRTARSYKGGPCSLHQSRYQRRGSYD